MIYKDIRCYTGFSRNAHSAYGTDDYELRLHAESGRARDNFAQAVDGIHAAFGMSDISSSNDAVG